MAESTRATGAEPPDAFRLAFDEAPIGMALVDIDGRWLRVNRSLCELTGYTADELLAGRFQDITYPDDLESDLEYVKQTLAGERRGYRMDKRYVRKDGEIVWASLSVSLVRDAGGSAARVRLPDRGHHRTPPADRRARAAGAAHGSRARRDHRPRRRPQHGDVLERGGRAGLWLRRPPWRSDR